MAGIFDDVFDIDWDQDIDDDVEESPTDESDLWCSGAKADLWNSDDPWVSEDEPEVEQNTGNFDMSDFFD